jgi:hypothetical protein
LPFVGERRTRKGDGGDGQRLATARDHEGRARALVSASHGALRERPSSRKKRASYPPKDLGRNVPLALREGWAEADRAKKVTGMARTFSIDTAASPSLVLERARRAASENGVTLLGNERSGRFSHKMLRGEYRRIGRTVIVTITYKHRLVPWSVLEGRLRALFGGGSSRKPRVHDKSTAPTAPCTQARRRATRRHPRHRRHPPHR